MISTLPHLSPNDLRDNEKTNESLNKTAQATKNIFRHNRNHSPPLRAFFHKIGMPSVAAQTSLLIGSLLR